MWVRGLKHRCGKCDLCRQSKSHPMWVRGLKLIRHKNNTLIKTSHPMWVRGLKRLHNEHLGYQDCRTPCGCVD